jgi:hypothetical protein
MMKNALSETILDVFPNFHTFVGFSTFATEMKINIPLNEIFNFAEFASTIPEQERVFGNRNTGEALSDVFDSMWTFNRTLDPSKNVFFLVFKIIYLLGLIQIVMIQLILCEHFKGLLISES